MIKVEFKSLGLKKTESLTMTKTLIMINAGYILIILFLYQFFHEKSFVLINEIVNIIPLKITKISTPISLNFIKIETSLLELSIFTSKRFK